MNEQSAADDASLEQIEGDSWGDPPAEATGLMTTVHRLRRKPVGALSPTDLRVLIAQQVGLDVLIPPHWPSWNSIRYSKVAITPAMCSSPR